MAVLRCFSLCFSYETASSGYESGLGFSNAVNMGRSAVSGSWMDMASQNCWVSSEDPALLDCGEWARERGAGLLDRLRVEVPTALASPSLPRCVQGEEIDILAEPIFEPPRVSPFLFRLGISKERGALSMSESDNSNSKPCVSASTSEPPTSLGKGDRGKEDS